MLLEGGNSFKNYYFKGVGRKNNRRYGLLLKNENLIKKLIIEIVVMKSN